ncbi:DNA-binding response regulator [Blautia sp. BCRC 81119]|jgi:two-component system, OmpR family, response regulator CssR|nr:DNA-binding response regulator [Blautia sp. BCRC 81119]QCU01434.1 response regulator transcription factor [Blautia sp. SC05B48]
MIKYLHKLGGMNMANICLIDDEKALNQVLKTYLERDGHSVAPYYCIQDIYRQANWYSLYDLYIIDIMLPDGSGTELMRKIKDKNRNIPVILISARGECIDRVLGFEMGCDDYLAKPFLPAELCYRVSNLLKNNNISLKKLINFNGYSLDEAKRTICTEQQLQIPVTSKEFDIILYFVMHPSVAISRDQLLTDIWGESYYGYYRVVDNHIKNIRRKLPKFHLETIYGFGYRCTL